MDNQWKGRALGAILFESAMISQDDIERALAEQKKSGLRFGEALVKLEIVTKEDVNWGLSHQFNIPFIRILPEMIDPEAVRLVPESVARRHFILPYLLLEDELTVVVEDPTDARMTAELAALTGKRINIGVGLAEQILEALDQVYGQALPDKLTTDLQTELFTPAQCNAFTQDPTGRLFIEALLEAAAEQGAAIVYFESQPTIVRVSFRFGERLKPVVELSPAWMQIVVRGLLNRIRPWQKNGAAKEGLLQTMGPAHASSYTVALLENIAGASLTITDLLPPRFANSLAELPLAKKARDDLERQLQQKSGLSVVLGADSPYKRRLLRLIVEARANRGGKTIAVGRFNEFGGAAHFISSDSDPSAALQGALALGPDELIVDNLATADWLQQCVEFCLHGGRVWALMPIAAPDAALQAIAEGLARRSAALSIIGGVVALKMIAELNAKIKIPDRRFALHKELLKPAPKGGKKASLYREDETKTADPADTPYEPSIAVLDLGARKFPAGAWAEKIAKLLFAQWDADLRERLFAGRIGLNDYLREKRGAGHAATR